MRADADPACWSWPLPQGDYDELGGNERRLSDFHQGCCAICGTQEPGLVEDHDHYTGFTRGRLCRSCNTLEGKSDKPLFVKYRQRHPCAILGLELIYFGPRWEYERDAGKFHDREEAGVWGHNAAARIGL